MRKISVALVSALALLAAGCGGSTSKSGVSSSSGAAMIRSDALAYVAVDSDLSSSQWSKVDKLLQKFPGRQKALDALNAELAKQGVKYDRDVKPALGSEVDVALVAQPSIMHPSFVALTKPDSDDKYKALIAKLNKDSSGSPAVYRKVGDWYALSDSQGAIDRTLKTGNGKGLNENSAFKDALDELSGDALAKAYVNGSSLAQLMKGGSSGIQQGLTGSLGLSNLKWIAAAVKSQDDGIRLDGATKGGGSGQLTNVSKPYASKLISGVPSGALAFATFRGGSSFGRGLDQLQSNPGLGQALGGFERTFGVRLADLQPLLKNEVAFYVRPGSPLPEFSLVLETPDQAAAKATVDKLMRNVARLAHAGLSTAQEDGVSVTTLTLRQFAIRYASFDGRLLFTSGSSGIRDYRGGGAKLSDDQLFKDAKSGAGVPDKTGGLVYVNLKDLIPVIENFATTAGTNLPPDARDNLEPLRSFVSYGATEGDVSKFSAFLEIK
jgi:hypothetical protein